MYTANTLTSSDFLRFAHPFQIENLQKKPFVYIMPV